jgi:hypothetical protein
MLQRPQTLFLLAAFVITAFLLTGPLAVIPVEGGEIMLKHSGAYDRTGNRLNVATWPLTVFFAVVTGLAFLNIFLYKHRVRQMRICVFLILLNAGMLGIIYYYVRYVKVNFGGTEVIYQWRIVIPLIVMIMLYLAYRRIRRDELLVRAYDRIR